MDSLKENSRRSGIVYSSKIVQHNLNFIVNSDPLNFEASSNEAVESLFASIDYFHFDVYPLLQYLPDDEAEIIFFILIKKKRQEDIKSILGVSQPTISTRLRRACQKLRYLSVLISLDLDTILDTIPGLRYAQKLILRDLFFYLNQELVAQLHKIETYQVRYLVQLTFKKVLAQQKEHPTQYAPHAAVFIFLKRHLRLRLLTEAQNG